MRKSLKAGGTLLLGFTVALSAFVLPRAYAAESVETDRECSLSFAIGGTYEELNETPVTVNLYKVADMTSTGEYTALAGFEDLDLGQIGSDMTAEEWEQKAQSASDIVETAQTQPAAVVTTAGGEGTASGLDTGMYLVEAEAAQSAYYDYTFSPYLISLPNNYYYGTGNDEWVYDVTGNELKPEQEARMGSVEIDKDLLSFNGSGSAQATFVFQIDITTLKGETETRQAAMNFTGAGSESLVIDEIPAGASVTVTEVYSGAGYELAEGSSAEQSAQVIADDIVSVTFQNEQDGTPNGGYGVVNHYSIDENGQWQWSQMADSAQ